MSTKISNPRIIVNNQAVLITPNSFSYNEGFGERAGSVQSGGGGTREIAYAENLESAKGSCKFAIEPTKVSIDLARAWQAAGNANTVKVTASDGFSRTFTHAFVSNDPDLNLGADVNIEIEFESDPAV